MKGNGYSQQISAGTWLTPYLSLHTTNDWTCGGTTIIENATTDYDDLEPLTAQGCQLMYDENRTAHETAKTANNPVATLSEFQEVCAPRTTPKPTQCVAPIDKNDAVLVNLCCDKHVVTKGSSIVDLFVDKTHPYYNISNATESWLKNVILPTPPPAQGAL